MSDDKTIKKSNYITPEGMQALRDEVRYLWKTERPKVTQSVSEAAAQGDRSENAEYTYGKKRLREIDRRLRFLSKRIEALQVVNDLPRDQSKIYFAAWVTLEDINGSRVNYRIIGPDEIDLKKSYISIDSPMGRALIGHRVNDKIVVKAPEGEKQYYIVAISYDQL